MSNQPQRISNVSIATMTGDGYGLVPDGVVDFADGMITYVGSRVAAPKHHGAVFDGAGGLLTPGLIDCHTHLVWAGSRADEFSQRLHGASYADIAAAGGGIAATVRATRAATLAELIAVTEPRLQALMAEGVTTIEIKSGYGLSLSDERKQ